MGVKNEEKINEILHRGVTEVINEESLRKKLESGKSLRVKFGIDPTGSKLHLGHMVPLRKLRQFQDLGHQVILLIGDYTAMIGDPTGRDQTRPVLALDDVKENMKTYLEQAAKVMDVDKLELRHNSEWYSQPGAAAFMMELTSKITVARILERDDFQKRLKEGLDIQMQEIFYPLLQGYDSVALKADVEIGGNDQKYNLLMGRKLQKKYGQEEQDVLMTPLLEGTDGARKMSKSYDNYIAVDDEPSDMFGKVMSIPDELIVKYFELATAEPFDTLETVRARLAKGENPRDVKMELALAIVKLYHGAAAAKKAHDFFVSTVQNKELPKDIPEFSLAGKTVLEVLVAAKLVKSNSQGKRDIDGGGVKVNGAAIKDYDYQVAAGDIVQKGKLHFVKIK